MREILKIFDTHMRLDGSFECGFIVKILQLLLSSFMSHPVCNVVQKWENALHEHIAYSLHLGSRVIDDDKDDEVLPLGCLQDSLRVSVFSSSRTRLSFNRPVNA